MLLPASTLNVPVVPSSQAAPTQRLSGGAVPGGRGIGTIDIEQEETRDAEYRAREGGGALGQSTSNEAFEKATTADGMSMLEGDAWTETRARSRSRAGSVKKTPSSVRAKRASMSTPMTVSATGAFVDHVIELPAEDDGNDVDGKQHTPSNGKKRTRATSVGSRRSSEGIFSTTREVEVVGNSGGRPRDRNNKGNEKGKEKSDTGKRPIRPTEEDEESPQSACPPNPKLRPIQRRASAHSIQTDDEAKGAPAEASEPRRRRAAKMTIDSDLEVHSDAGGRSEVSMPPRRPTAAGSATPVKSGMKPRPRSKSQSRPSSILGAESEEEVRVVPAESGTKKGTGKRREEVAKPSRQGGVATKEKVKGKTNQGKETKKIAPHPRSPTRSPSPTSPGTKSSRGSKRRLSVLVPSVPEDYFSSQEVRGVENEDGHERGRGKRKADAGTSSTRRPLVPAASMRAIAAEASTSTSKRGKPSPAKISTPTTIPGKSKAQPQAKAKPKAGPSKAVAKARADDGEDMGETDNDISMIVNFPGASTSRSGPRRSAANKATTRLRDEVMPDVVNFEKEQKQAKRRRSAGGESVASLRDEEDEVREERAGKRRKVVVVEEEEEEAEVEDVVLVASVNAKPKPVKGKGRAKGAPAVDSGDDEDVPPAKNKANGFQEKGPRGRGKDPAAVRLMTTGVALLDDVVKVSLHVRHVGARTLTTNSQ